MINSRTIHTNFLKSDYVLYFLLFTSIFILQLGLWIELPWLGLIVPLIIVGSYFLFFQLKKLYLLLFFLISFSSELYIGSGIGIDFPPEILLLILSVLSVFLLSSKPMQRYILFPIGLILILQVSWSLISMIHADNSIISAKWIAAKLWYILPFFVLPSFLNITNKDLNRLIDIYLIGLFLAASYFFLDHATTGFDFMAKASVGKPIWRNHVNYACTLVVSLPLIWYRYQVSGRRYRYLFLGLLFLIFIYFSYARVAYLCMAAWLSYLWIIKWKITLPAILISMSVVLFIGFHYLNNERYIRLAPEYEQAITQGSFDKKIEATLEGRDISTMERLHRWVAGYRIVKEHLITGVGPSNFFTSYKPYTLNSFETYVSDNPEKSGIHNYFLMLTAEQGVPGLLLFLILISVALVVCEQKYHQNIDPIFLMAGSIIIIILAMNTINDMVEVIKIGSWFYFCLFLISRKSHKPLSE